ncbi:MAG: hypothetical protein LWY06_16465 [Firmicutes bacterium]|nr:hypothetical protein [Bacillota bacterium]
MIQGWFKSDKFKKASEYFLAGLLFLMLAIIPVYSLMLKFSTAYIGSGELQGWLWRFWWMKKLIASAASVHPSNLWLVVKTALTAGNYPETGNIFDLILFSMPLEGLSGAPLYYNIKVLLILVLNGMAGYAMCRYFRSSKAAALAGGAFLILNPYILYEIASGRIRQAILFAMPLFVIHLFETYRTGSWKHTFFAGFWLGITSALYLFYGMSLFFFLFLFIIGHIIAERKNFNRSFLTRTVVIIILFAAITVPFCLRYIEMALGKEGLPETRFGTGLPSLNLILGKEHDSNLDADTEASIRRYNWDSAELFFPFKLKGRIYIPLIFTIIILLPLFFRRPTPWLWITALLFFSMLALGPYLKTGGLNGGYFLIAGKPVVMPYAIFYKYVPAFSRLFSPIRWMGFMSVAGAVLLSLNLNWLLEKLNSGVLKNKASLTGAASFTIITTLCVFQMYSSHTFPLVSSTAVPPAVYTDTAKDEMMSGVFEIPMPPVETTYYYQSIHGKRLPGAPTAIPGKIFEPTEAGKLAERPENDMMPFIGWLNSISVGAEPSPLTDENIQAVEKRGFEIIIVHERDFEFKYPGRGKELYNKALSTLGTKLTPSGSYEEIWSEMENEGNRGVEKRAAIAVFRLPDKEDDDDSQDSVK